MASRGQRIKDFLNRNFEDAGGAFKQAFSYSDEDARNQLFELRDKQNKDEPMRLVQVAARVPVIDNIREALTARNLPGGFNDEGLRHRVEAGRGMIKDPTIFDRAIQAEIDKRDDALRQDPSVKGYEFDKAPLPTVDEDKIVADTLDQIKREMRGASLGKKAGYTVGNVASDIAQDGARSLYWLLNAAQASGAVIADAAMSGANPNLRTKRKIQGESLRRAQEAGLLKPAKGVEFGSDTDPNRLNARNYEPISPGLRLAYDDDTKSHYYAQRRLNPTVVGLAGLGATGLAINAGVGLGGTEDSGLPIVGRREGYKAAAPSELDPRETANIVEEIGKLYILSRGGQLLPSDDFRAERPDVSASDYAKYQAYKFDRDTDLNPLDGNFNVAGVLKGTNDGVHGSEIAVLGQPLSYNEAGQPFLGALGGAVLGGVLPNLRQLRMKGGKGIRRFIPEVAPKTFNRDADLVNPLIKKGSYADKITGGIEDYFTELNPVTQQRDMNVGQTSGLMAGLSAGGLLTGTLKGQSDEDQRRRKQFEERVGPNVDYDLRKKLSKEALDRKYARIKADPNALAEKENNWTGYSNRQSQAVAADQYLNTQAQINQLPPGPVRNEMQQLQYQSLDELDEMIGREIAIRDGTKYLPRGDYEP